MCLRVAITGGIACGKSLFSHYLGQLGVDVLDADDVVHRLEAPGGAAVAAIRSLFGEQVVRPDGGIDRAALGDIVFHHEAARDQLNRLIHPLVKEVIHEWLELPGGRLKAVVIPLLFEVGWDRDWDVIICLACSEAVQIDRLIRVRGLSAEQARKRVAAQMPVAEKAARSHRVVNNDADAEALAREASEVYRFLIERSE
jgi:dephospho-CoA kinase